MGIRILVVQFRVNGNAGFERQPIARVLEGEHEIIFKNALTNEINLQQPQRELEGYGAVILSGSAELYFDGGLDEANESRLLASRVAETAKPFAQYLIEKNIPTLGICFGHQLLGHAAGAPVGHSRLESKTGTYTIELTEEGERDPLMQDMPKQFAAHYGHKDVLFDVPEGATVLACGGDRCRFSALKYGKCVYSVQFHPELSRDEIQALITNYPEYLPEHADIGDLFGTSDEAERVLRNFAALAVRT